MEVRQALYAECLSLAIYLSAIHVFGVPATEPRPLKMNQNTPQQSVVLDHYITM